MANAASSPIAAPTATCRAPICRTVATARAPAHLRLQPVRSRAASRGARLRAKSTRLWASMSPSIPPRPAFLREAGVANFLDWTSGLHMCFPNAEEAALLTGSDDPARQMAMLNDHYDVVVIKRGGQGADAGDAHGGRWHCRRQIRCGQRHDRRGRRLYAGFIAGYLRGQPLQTCLEDGVAAGTHSTTTSAAVRRDPIGVPHDRRSSFRPQPGSRGGAEGEAAGGGARIDHHQPRPAARAQSGSGP